jgi:hypothetical protein
LGRRFQLMLFDEAKVLRTDERSASCLRVF